MKPGYMPASPALHRTDDKAPASGIHALQRKQETWSRTLSPTPNWTLVNLRGAVLYWRPQDSLYSKGYKGEWRPTLSKLSQRPPLIPWLVSLQDPPPALRTLGSCSKTASGSNPSETGSLGVLCGGNTGPSGVFYLISR